MIGLLTRLPCAFSCKKTSLYGLLCGTHIVIQNCSATTQSTYPTLFFITARLFVIHFVAPSTGENLIIGRRTGCVFNDGALSSFINSCLRRYMEELFQLLPGSYIFQNLGAHLGYVEVPGPNLFYVKNPTFEDMA